MKLQVLVSTMHQNDYSLLEKMNIQSDAIVVNQCNCYSTERFKHNGNDVLWMSMDERGVGLSRNTALMRADGDILLFADDDVVYKDGYADEIVKCFENNPKADFIVFNLKSLNSERKEKDTNKNYKLRWYNSLKFGTYRIAVRKNELYKANIFYSLLFGGGAKYQCGEDSLFITQCLQKGLKGLASDIYIGTVNHQDSTWFKGYDEKYYYDRGALFADMYPKIYFAVLALMEFKDNKKCKKLSFIERYKLDIAGAKKFKTKQYNHK